MGRLVFRSSTSVDRRPLPRRPLVDRFWEKVDVRGDDECWLWLAGTDGHGYGHIGAGGKFGPKLKAHRVAYELLVGPIVLPELDHLCRVPRCVNPRHLEPVTHRENQRRGHGMAGQNARKTTCPLGHAYASINYRSEER